MDARHVPILTVDEEEVGAALAPVSVEVPVDVAESAGDDVAEPVPVDEALVAEVEVSWLPSAPTMGMMLARTPSGERFLIMRLRPTWSRGW